MSKGLIIKKLKTKTEGKEIIKEANLEVKRGEIVALIGPNGSGKSTLAHAIMGKPGITITGGEIILNGEKINDLSPEERAKKGLFLSFQHPIEIGGLSIEETLKKAIEARTGERIRIMKFKRELREKAEELGIKEELLYRGLNEGFSGGEKKKMELLQMIMLKPEIAILDEIDSGLDIDALKKIAETINRNKEERGTLVITHYKKMLEYLKPDKVIVMIDGETKKEGNAEIIKEIEEKGYQKIGL